MHRLSSSLSPDSSSPSMSPQGSSPSPSPLHPSPSPYKRTRVRVLKAMDSSTLSDSSTTSRDGMSGVDCKGGYKISPCRITSLCVTVTI